MCFSEVHYFKQESHVTLFVSFAVEEEAHAQVRLSSARFAVMQCCQVSLHRVETDFRLIGCCNDPFLGWSVKGERWGRGPSRLPSPPWLWQHMLPTTRPVSSAGDPGPSRCQVWGQWRPYQPEAAELQQQIDAGELIQDLLDDRLFLWDILESLFLIPQLLSFVFVYTLIKGFGLKKKQTDLVGFFVFWLFKV